MKRRRHEEKLIRLFSSIGSKLIVFKPYVFKADHPFIFLIQENQTGNILFVGRVSDPAE